MWSDGVDLGLEEKGESFVQECVDERIVSVFTEEVCEGGEEAVGGWFAVDATEGFLFVNSVCLFECSFQMLWQFVTQVFLYEHLAKMCAAAFVAEHVAQ